MSYRILVHPDASDALRTLPEPVLRRAGQLLAEAAHEPSPIAADAEPLASARGRTDAGEREANDSLQRLESDCCVLLYEVDSGSRALTVMRIEARA